MYCSECGKPASGKFCSHCGSALAGSEGASPPVPAEVVPDWENEVRYEAILQYPGVRTTIERHAKLAPKRMTGEQFLALADKIVPLGVSMEGVAVAAQAMFTRLGIRTGKQRRQHVPAPAGRVLVRALCSLARHGQALRTVTQAADGCVLEAALPSDLLSLEGDLLISILRSGQQADVQATARIGGQVFDWGKSSRCLERLFSDLGREAA